MICATTNFKPNDLLVRKARRAKGRPFMGVDGEGCGIDRHGRQHYMLLRAGPHECFTGKPLNTIECLDFILSLPADYILCGFAFGYDTTQILRDLDVDRLTNAECIDGKLVKPGTGIFDAREHGDGAYSRYTYWRDYAIEYLPKNYLRVAKLERCTVIDAATDLPKQTWRVAYGSVRTIWETFGFFQSSFLKALQAYDIGRRFWDDISRNKRQRAHFKSITKGVRRYCELECLLLAQLMEKFRSTCHAADIRPNQWAGSGRIAGYLHRINKTMTHNALLDKLDVGLLSMANDAYYGGRFEITRTGDIPACVEADINSAYPAAMLSLPCLTHGTWARVEKLWLANAPASALFVAEVSFAHPEGIPLCGLPIRHERGFLYWPREGSGTYWSCEIRSAEKLGASITYKQGLRYVPHCKCKPFAWVETLYRERKRLECIAEGRGQPIKLGINSLYGKLAQRVGAPTYGNFVWAGLITAQTRATLNNAIVLDPDNIVMIATDAIVSLKPLSLSYGKDLGQWDRKDHERLFVVQPGLYWSGRTKRDKRKTRGTSVSMFARHMHRFEKAWVKWCEKNRPLARFHTGDGNKWRSTAPAVACNMTLFIGLRLANARGALLTAGQWARMRREFSFDWSRKRDMAYTWEGPTTLRTLPLPGGPDVKSKSHKDNLARLAELDIERMRYEDQPELIDRSMPGLEHLPVSPELA